LYRRLLTLFDFFEAIAISAMVRFTLSYLPASFRLRWMGKSIPPDSAILTSISENDVSLECREKLLRRKDGKGEIGGHAWLKVGPYFITGYRPDLDEYVINGQFGPQ